MSSKSSGQSGQCTKRRILLLIAGGTLFVILMMMALAYGVSRPQNESIEAAERDAISQCQRSSEDPEISITSRSFQVEACREMESQFQNKFRRAS